MFRRFAAIALSALLVATPGSAHKVIESGSPAKILNGAILVKPQSRWNRLQQRAGTFQEVWTIDGDRLNKIVFYAGVPVGQPLLRERSKKRDPLPKVAANMLLPDIPVLLERTYRTQYGLAIMSIGKQEPATLGGQPAIAFQYSFIDPDFEVETKGEAVAVMLKGKLYLVAFEAPSTFYFDRDVAKFRELTRTVTLSGA